MSAAAKAALVSLLTTTFVADSAVLVSSGEPDPSPIPDIVAVTGPSRAGADGEEETFDLGIVVSCYVGGGNSAQAVATARAYSLWASVRAAIYAAPTLSGTARVAALDNEHRTAETVAYDATNQIPIGRLTEIVGTVTVHSGRLLLGSVRSAHNVP